MPVPNRQRAFLPPLRGSIKVDPRSFRAIVASVRAHPDGAQLHSRAYIHGMTSVEGSKSSEMDSPKGYRDLLSAATARIEALERENRALTEQNRWLMGQPRFQGPRHGSQIPPELRRRWIQRRIRALRRDLRATVGIRRYASSAIIAVSAAAAFVIIAAESAASWPLAIAIMCMGAVARSLVSQWPGFDEVQTRQTKLETLEAELAQLRGDRQLPASIIPTDREAALHNR
jgi:hypothetical protein